MKLDLQFHYTITYVKPRHQNASVATGAAWTSVEIAEIDGALAPVVMTVGNGPDREFAKKYEGSGCERFLLKADGSQREIRLKDGKYYVEGMAAAEFAERATSLATVNGTFLAAYDRTTMREPSHALGYRQEPETVHSLRRRFDGLREDKTDDDRGRVAAAIAAQAASMFVIDGTVYENCREPVFALSAAGEYGIVEAAPSLWDRVNFKVPGFGVTSSLVEADHVMRSQGLDPLALSFSVLDEAASSYDGLAADIAAGLRYVLGSLDQRADALPLPVMTGYLKLREAMAFLDMVNPAVSPELVEAMEALASAGPEPLAHRAMEEIGKGPSYVRGSAAARLPSLDQDTGFRTLGLFAHSYLTDYDDVSDIVERVKELLARWDSRPPGAAFDDTAAHRATSFPGGGYRVSELRSLAAVRKVAADFGTSFSEAEALVDGDWRFYTVSDGERKPVTQRDETAPSKISAVAIRRADGFMTVLEGASMDAGSAVAAVARHVEAMGEMDRKVELDQQPISIF